MRSSSIIRTYINNYKITEYLYINIYDCDYSKEKGISHKEKDKNCTNIEDRMY